MPTQRLTIEPATEAHALLLAKHLRPEDAAEVMASHGLGPLAGVQMALKLCPNAKAIMDGKRIVALFGAVPATDMEGVASIWLLASKLAKRLPIAFMRAIAPELRALTEAWAVLANMVWAQNKRALRWVGALGFEVLEPVPFGVSGLPFHPIILRRS